MRGKRVCQSVLLLVAVAGGFAATPGIAQIVYVNRDAAGGNTGVDWANAYNSLQTALQSGWGIEIWVAQGIYTPAPPGGSAAETFALRDGLAVYGGFAGNETQRDQRDPSLNVTTLSGDLNGYDLPGWVNMSENSDNLVTASGV